MIHLNPALPTDPAVLWILGAAVVLVFSLQFYVRRLIGNTGRVVPMPVKPIVDYRQANMKR